MPDLNADQPMENRVHKLEEGLKTLEHKVEKLHATLHEALLGTLDGKPGIVATLHNSLEASRQNSVKLDALVQQMDGLRLDRAKVMGIVITVSALWSTLLVLLKYAI